MYRTSIAPLSGLLLLFSAAIIWAQQAQDWIPSEISLPDDMEVMVDRAIGSSTRIFSFATGENPSTMLENWRGALQEGGYIITETPETPEAIDSQTIEFRGRGIGNAQIAVQPSSEDGRNVVQFDASLN